MARAHGVEDTQMEQVDLVEDVHAHTAADIFQVDGNYDMLQTDAGQQPAVELGLFGLACDVVQRDVQYGLYIVVAERLSDKRDAQQPGGQHVQLLLLLDVFIIFVETHRQQDKHARDERVFEHILAVDGRDAARDDPKMRYFQKTARELETQPLVVEVEPQKLVADALERVMGARPVEQLRVDLLDDVQRRESVMVGQQLVLVHHRKVQLVARAQRLFHQVQQRRELAVKRLDGLLDAAQARINRFRGQRLGFVPIQTGAVLHERTLEPQPQTPLAAALAGVSLTVVLASITNDPKLWALGRRNRPGLSELASTTRSAPPSSDLRPLSVINRQKKRLPNSTDAFFSTATPSGEILLSNQTKTGPAPGQRLFCVVAVGNAAVDARGARRDVAGLVHEQHLSGPRRTRAALNLAAANNTADLLFHPLIAVELRRRRLDDSTALDHLELFEAACFDVALELNRAANCPQHGEKVDPVDLVVVDDHQAAANLGQRRKLDSAHLLVVDHAECHARGFQFWQLELAEPVVDELRRVLHHLQAVQVQAAGVLDGDGVGPGVDSLEEPVVVDVERLERLDVEARKARQRGVAHHNRVNPLDALVKIDGAQNRKHLPLDRVDAFQLGQRNRGQGGQRVQCKGAIDGGELDALDSQQTARVGHAQRALDVGDGAEVQTVGVVALDVDVAGDDPAVVEFSHVAGRVDVVVLLETFGLDFCVLCVVGVVGCVDEAAKAAACQRAEDGKHNGGFHDRRKEREQRERQRYAVPERQKPRRVRSAYVRRDA
ncbi:hypothetical protein OGATHE_003550 [Ogataea polymorpha]|uniref:Uncharacterized protein n=1 Tax=Ogataea polymorpha TaxID=460523 RepID=A0A9P8P474_9ASCO|nr:hypothetical protein OGATHE_003550 [Ogataea polymorpha]